MKRLGLLVVLGLALGVATQAEAHTLKTSTAERYVTTEARYFYSPARVYLSFCTRRSRHRVNCRILAFYDDNYCSAWFHAYSSRRGRIIIGGPLLERC